MRAPNLLLAPGAIWPRYAPAYSTNTCFLCTYAANASDFTKHFTFLCSVEVGSLLKTNQIQFWWSVLLQKYSECPWSDSTARPMQSRFWKLSVVIDGSAGSLKGAKLVRAILCSLFINTVVGTNFLCPTVPNLNNLMAALKAWSVIKIFCATTAYLT